MEGKAWGQRCCGIEGGLKGKLVERRVVGEKEWIERESGVREGECESEDIGER